MKRRSWYGPTADGLQQAAVALAAALLVIAMALLLYEMRERPQPAE